MCSQGFEKLLRLGMNSLNFNEKSAWCLIINMLGSLHFSPYLMSRVSSGCYIVFANVNVCLYNALKTITRGVR